MRKLTIASLTVAIIASLLYLYYTEIKPVVIFGLRSDYAHAIPFQKIPEGLTSLKAESCGQCHREIYDEWRFTEASLGMGQGPPGPGIFPQK